MNPSWHVRNRSRSTAYKKRERDDKRRRARQLYGNFCVGCGETDESVLTIDHVQDDGCVERKTVSPDKLYRRLALRESPDPRYQVLCMNCQWRKVREGPDPRKWFGGQIDLLKMCEHG
jgi:hypothetical protein